MLTNVGKLITALEERRPINTKSEQLIRRCYEFAKQVHQGQKRKTGESYIEHPARVAAVLGQIGMDPVTIAAGLLHDVTDTGMVSHSQLKSKFGEEIANLVKAVTNVKKVSYDDPGFQLASMKHTLTAIAGDVRVAVIRLADRYDNMLSLHVHPKAKRDLIAAETLEIYSPIADRLGIGYLKGDLEDLSFYYLFPAEYRMIKKSADRRIKAKRASLTKVRRKISQVLKTENLMPVDIDLRDKHYYSLFRKMQRCDMDLDQVEDLVVIRIKVESINQCYLALRAIHKNFKFIPGRIKDYIALPKANGYQALHTVIFDTTGGVTEVQIKTMKMHNQADLGRVANPAEELNEGSCDTGAQWLKHLNDWQNEFSQIQDEESFIALKDDLLKNRIVVFDQLGKVYDLPEGSTIIDFSFASHGPEGIHTAKGKVNNHRRVLCHRLRNGDIVEVDFDHRLKLKKNLLQCTKTSAARKFLSPPKTIKKL